MIMGQPAIGPGVSLGLANSLENLLYLVHRSQPFTGRQRSRISLREMTEFRQKRRNTGMLPRFIFSLLDILS